MAKDSKTHMKPWNRWHDDGVEEDLKHLEACIVEILHDENCELDIEDGGNKHHERV
ncbi:V/A-type H+-transporting ATPase subunit A [Sesbania bispinosa]|nr:V/A-type H+-transporting ATPase subunit A [Sesbania bispinosa]